MKGLIFNLLDSMARNSGCADEAWDLVMEFVASETEHEAQTDSCLCCFVFVGVLVLVFVSFVVVLFLCFVGEGGLRESASEFPELGLSSEADDWSLDSVPAMMDPDACLPQALGTNEGFSHDLLNLLEQLLAEALTGDAEAEDPEIEDLAKLNRRTSH